MQSVTVWIHFTPLATEAAYIFTVRSRASALPYATDHKVAITNVWAHSGGGGGGGGTWTRSAEAPSP